VKDKIPWSFHIELRTAIERKMLVIPVLVGGAEMPSEADLPLDLQPLARRNALQITEQDWDEGMGKLIRTLEQVVASSSQDILRAARTAHVATRTMYFTPESLEKALAGEKGFDALGLALVKDVRVADLLITIDRPLFTYTFTYSVTDSKTSRVLDAGKVTAIIGGSAAGKIAKQLVSKWAKVRGPEPPSKPN
jgi:hypothetical protein